MTREEAIEFLLGMMAFGEDDIGSADMEYYIQNLMEGNDIYDIDRAVWLNTLMGYDVGYETAHKIDMALYGDDLEMLEISHMDKGLVQSYADRLNLHLDFSRWAEEEPKTITYDWLR